MSSASPWSPVYLAWQDDAQCNEADFDFVPMEETRAGLTAARQWCDICPVRSECLRYALLYRLPGYWGGTDLYQRRQLSAVKRRASCPLCGSHNVIPVEQHELCLACAVSWQRERRLQPV